MARHRRGDDEGATALFFKMGTDSFGTVGSAVQINLNDLVPRSGGTLDNASIGRGASAGNTGLAS